MITVPMKWLKLSKEDEDISQIYTNGLEFAFATKTRQRTPFVYCKDFLHDCVYACLYKKSIDPYGFKYNPSKNPIAMKRTYILVANSSDNKLGEKIEPCLDFLNQAEKKLHLRRTTIFECETPPSPYKKCGVYLFRGSCMWLNAAPMLSLYSLFIRLGFCHKIGDDFTKTIEQVRTGKVKSYQSNDASYLSQSADGINRIFAVGYRKFFFKETAKNYPVNVDIMTLHNYFGIVGFSQLFSKNGYTKPYHADKTPKYWRRKSLVQLCDERLKQEKIING